MASKRDVLVKLAILTALALATVAIAAVAFAGKGGVPSGCGLGQPTASPPDFGIPNNQGRSEYGNPSGQGNTTQHEASGWNSGCK